MAVKTYRKTALVTAEQFLPGIGQIPKGVYSDTLADPRKQHISYWCLDTKEGRHTLRGGDYICTGPAGEQWNVASEIFEATYEEVTNVNQVLKYRNSVDGKTYEFISESEGMVSFKREGRDTQIFLCKDEFDKRYQPLSNPSPSPTPPPPPFPSLTKEKQQ